MKLSLILIFCLLFISKSQDTTASKYTINTFINYLKDMGYWVVIEDVKIKFGDDVSIVFCKEMVPSPHC